MGWPCRPSLQRPMGPTELQGEGHSMWCALWGGRDSPRVGLGQHWLKPHLNPVWAVETLPNFFCGPLVRFY